MIGARADFGIRQNFFNMKNKEMNKMTESKLENFVKKEIFDSKQVKLMIEKEAISLARYILNNNVTEIVTVTVLEGGKYFALKLMEKIEILIYNLNKSYYLKTINDAVKISSYDGTNSGKIEFTKALSANIADKIVLIIEDIVDSGKTMNYLLKYMEKYNPKKVLVASLCIRNKDNANISKILDPNYYFGFITNSDDWFIGCGLDYNGQFRELESVYSLKDQYKY